jgi:hypothetical protein
MALVNRIDDLKGNVDDIVAVKDVLCEAERTSRNGDQFNGHYKVTSTGEVRINLYSPDGTAPEVSMTPPCGSKVYHHSSGLILLGKTENGRLYQIDFSAKKKIEKFRVDESYMMSLADCLTEDSFSCSTSDSPKLLERLSTMKRVLGQFFRIDNSENPYMAVEYKKDDPILYFTIQNKKGNLPLIEHVHNNGCMVGELYHKPFEFLSMVKRDILSGDATDEFLFKDS